MNQTKAIFSKWIIEGLDGFVFGSDKELYRLPFQSYPNNYGLRKLEKQAGNRWKVNSNWISARQLKKSKRIKINLNPEVLIFIDPDLPF